MLGGRKMIRMARKKAQVYDRTQPHPPSQFDSDTERFLLSYGVPPASDGNCVELLTRGEEAFERIYQIIEEATSTIHITTYILGRDDVGDALIALLARKASSGVSVRLLLDSVGSWRIGRHYLGPCSKRALTSLISCLSCTYPSGVGRTCGIIARSWSSIAGSHFREA